MLENIHSPADIKHLTPDQIAAVGKIKEWVGGDAARITKLEEIVGAGGYSDLPNFMLGGVNLATTPSFSAFNLLLFVPFLAAGFQWLSMWLSRKWMGGAQPAGDAQTQASLRIMDFVMPLMTVWFTFNFSGMLGVYWIYQSIFAILQQYLLSKAMPLPKYTEAELRDMERAEKEKAKAQRSAMQSNPKVKSLHYIDDDDYDALPEVKAKNTEKKGTMGLSSSDLKDD